MIKIMSYHETNFTNFHIYIIHKSINHNFALRIWDTISWLAKIPVSKAPSIHPCLP